MWEKFSSIAKCTRLLKDSEHVGDFEMVFDKMQFLFYCVLLISWIPNDHDSTRVRYSTNPVETLDFPG